MEKSQHSPFLHTWTKQNCAKKIDIQTTFEWGYVTHTNSKIYDLSSGSYHQSFGLRNKRLEEALKAQITDLPMGIPKLQFDLKAQVSQKFVNRIGFDGRIFYTLSGAESNENAIKMARQITKKQFVLSCENSYHGATLGALSMTGDWRHSGAGIPASFHKFIPNFYNDPDLKVTKKIIDETGSDNIAAICLETITGGNGVHIPAQSYYTQIQEICNEYGIKLILDEVICGFGRTGKEYGFQHYQIRPDFISFAKAISGGFFPFGAVFVSEDNAKYFDDNILNCGLTNAAHPLGLRLLDEVLDYTKEESFIELKKSNEDLLTSFKSQIEKYKSIKEVRHTGMLMAVALSDDIVDIDKLWNELISNGIFVNIANRTIIICPYLNFPTTQLENCLQKLIETVEDNYVQ